MSSVQKLHSYTYIVNEIREYFLGEIEHPLSYITLYIHTMIHTLISCFSGECPLFIILRPPKNYLKF